ncbi:MAG: cell wall hydrolase [Clostridium sp.]|nr:cell wall hydrolase [Clostridium sp.]
MDKYRICKGILSFISIAAMGSGGIYTVNNACKDITENNCVYTDIPSVCTEISTTVVSTEPTDISDDFILNESEIYELASLVYLEVGIECMDCQKDVASVVINRMMIEDKSLSEVIYEDGQFSPANMIPYTEPTDEQLEAVRYIVENGCTLPVYVTYFRSGWYHEWGGLVGYKQYENTYFSYDPELKAKYE